jgi:NAD(P)-dependent dehydrogenase (short-subunit alcohol dehydrogenase family)
MKTVIITGASKGIGLAAAARFLQSGYHVINLSRSQSPLEGVENHSFDLTSDGAEQELGDLFSRLVSYGEIALIHNAARLVSDTAADTNTASFKDVLQINVVAPHILNRLLIPKMESGSSIVYLGSTLSEKAVPNSYSYVVSKHAVIGMMRSTCQDLAGTGIHTCCICPGFTDTEMLRAHVGEDPEVLSSIATLSTFGRLIQPDEIAATIEFAVDNPVINGAVIHANLGQVES